MAKGKGKMPFTQPAGPSYGANGTSENAPMPGPSANRTAFPVPGSPTGRVEYRNAARQSARPRGGKLGKRGR